MCVIPSFLLHFDGRCASQPARMGKLLLSWVTTRITLFKILQPCNHSYHKYSRFLRWKAIQDAVFVDPVDGKEKIWSESNVSEDFDMALRLILKGYIVRCVSIILLYLTMLRFCAIQCNPTTYHPFAYTYIGSHSHPNARASTSFHLIGFFF
jgi:Glycosyl transferase family group 2